MKKILHFNTKVFVNQKWIPCVLTYWDRNFVQLSHLNLTNSSEKNDFEGIKIPEPPTNCCMSGCANCVWIKYAEELAEIFHDAEEKVKKIILSKVDDPNMKAFLLTELKSVKFKK